MIWTNNLPDKEGFWLALTKDNSIPVLLELRIENYDYADFFGLRFPNNEGFLIAHISGCCDKITAYNKYERYCFIQTF